MKISLKRLVAGAAAAAVLSVGASGAARAQGPAGGGGGQMTPQQSRQAFYKEMKLSPAQVTKMEALQKKYTGIVSTRITALQKKYGQNPAPDQQQKAMAEMRTMGMQVQAQAKKEMATFLTPAQMTKMNAKMNAAAQAPRP